MVSQILFGERFSIAEASGYWLKIVTLFDGYEGWIDSSQGGYALFSEITEGVIAACEIVCEEMNGTRCILPAGSELFNLSEKYSSFSAGNLSYSITGKLPASFTADETVVQTASRFLNSPYLWGGRTQWGFDCSGFVQIVYKIQGIALPRDAAAQSGQGKMVNFIEESLPGDILFFSGESDNISHVGILIAPGKVIHSSGKVRTDTIDHQGIWNSESGNYTHRLRLIRRVI